MDNIRLCLMSCCAPCSCGAIAQLAERAESLGIGDFIVLFYNPNIFPESEYQKRLAEQVKYCESLGVKYAVGIPACAGMTSYNDAHSAWLSCVRGLEDQPERGRRCTECFKHRFAFGARWAAANGCNAIASVFGVSRHKSQEQVDDAIADLGLPTADLKITYIPVEWDESLRAEIDKKAGFYRQKYCGCEFSMKN